MKRSFGLKLRRKVLRFEATFPQCQRRLIASQQTSADAAGAKLRAERTDVYI